MRFIIILICLISFFYFGVDKSLSDNLNKDLKVALIYNGNIPTDVYHLYDWLVVDPNNPSINVLKQKFYLRNTAKLIAYVSLGEADKSVSYYNKVKEYGIGENKIWHSKIMNIENSKYRNFMIDDVLTKISDQGFQGFMFDTLDSYKLVVPKNEWPKFQNAEIQFIREVRKKFPNKIIVINRGFDIIDQTHQYINAVVAEGLYKDLNDKLNYIDVSAKDSKYLLSELNAIKNKYNLPIIVVDYADPKNKIEAEKDAKKITTDGFIPWVTNKNLSVIGTSNFKFIKRRVMVICNSQFDSSRIRMVLEYLGLVPETFHVNQDLPKGFLADRYRAAIIIVGKVDNTEKFYKWVREAIGNGLKVFFINNFGFPEDKQFLDGLDVKVYKNKASIADGYSILKRESGSDFEVPLNVEYDDTYIKPENAEPIVSIKNNYNQESVPFAVTKWGGYAVDNTLVNDRGLFIYNPFVFFKRFLKPDFPVPDTTTENGRILLFSQIDGDSDFGYTDFNPNEFIATYITKNFLEYYRIPTTVSVITADLMDKPYGLHLRRAKKLREIFREIFKYKNIEIASHTFSHPFDWPELVAGIYKKGYNLPVPDYKFSVKQEVEGSVNWINKELAPEGKRVRVILWSGDCRPPEFAVKMAYNEGIYNVNGEDTSISNNKPFLRYIKPMGKNVGNFFQVNAAITNEDIYTNMMRGPIYGYQNVIQTFQLTEKPYRLKPIYIYYHWYSGQYDASSNALKKVYDWAMSQQPIPEFVSQYAKKVLDFRSTAIAKQDDGWIIKNSGNIRTLRIPISWGYPDMDKSKGVVGYRIIDGREYISLSNAGYYYIYFSHQKPSFRLVEANGMVKLFKKTDKSYEIKLKSDPYVPLHFSIQSYNCNIKVESKSKYIKTFNGNDLNYEFINGREANVKAYCN